MRIKVELFCSLASHPRWRQWLETTIPDIFNIFIERFKVSTSCANNARIMMDILPMIDKIGKTEDLENFLLTYFPNILEHDQDDEYLRSIERFFYNKMLTYPRRCVIEGDPNELNDKIAKFLDKKIQYEFSIVGSRVFVEYLEEQDAGLQNKIPESKWLLKEYKKKRSQARHK